MNRVTGTGSGNDAPSLSVDELNAAIVAARADLLRRAFYLTRNRDQAMDLVQRTAERACASRAQLRPGSSAAHWLGAILTSQFIDEFRRRRASPFTSALAYDNIAAPSGDPVPSWGSLGITDVVVATRRLPDHFREPYELHALRGLSHRAISLRLGLRMGTIATRIHRAKILLKPILAARARALAGGAEVTQSGAGAEIGGADAGHDAGSQAITDAFAPGRRDQGAVEQPAV